MKLQKLQNFEFTRTQMNLYNVELLAANKAVNNITGILSVNKSFSLNKLEEAINLLIKEIDILRVQVSEDGTQYIVDTSAVEVETYNFKDKGHEYQKWVSEWKKISLFAYDSMLCSFNIVINPMNKIEIMMKLNHLITDLYTMSELAEKLISLLENENTTGYTDVIKQLDISIDNKKEKNFWRELTNEFEGSEAFHQVNNSDNSDLTDEIEFTIEGHVWEKIKSYCNSNSLNFYDFHLANMLYLKKVITMNNSSSIGIAVGRDVNASEKVLGPLTKVLPLIHGFNEDTDIENYFRLVVGKIQEVYENENCSMVDILAESSNDNLNSLVEISCIEKPKSLSQRYLEKGYEYETISSGVKHNPLTITVDGNNFSEKAILKYEFQKMKFSQNKVSEIHELLVHLFSQFVMKKNKKLSDISFITKKDKHLLEGTSNKFELKYNNILEMFYHQVEKSPENIAAKYLGESISFKTLDQKSTSFALDLRKAGGNTGDIIATSLTGINALIAIMGILKINAIYLPLDKNYPSDRLEYILVNSKTKLLIEEKKTILSKIKNDLPILDLELNHHNLEISSTRLENQCKAEDSAYIIYTSGSTGKPKGVVVKHLGVVNMCSYFKNLLNISEEDTVQQFASHSFDASILEIFGGLLNGSKVIFVDDNTKQDPQALQDLWDAEKVTFAIIPPVYMTNLDHERETPLKYLMTAGEEAQWSFVKKWSDKLTYINAYGPSEGTVWTTSWLSNKEYSDIGRVPIGQTMDNVQCHVVQDGKLCGVGIPGELYISGVSLAEGYLNDIALTQKSFVHLPNIEGIAYKTGDLAVWLSNGDLDFIGRNDSQVKVRGHRIELGEINNKVMIQNNIEEAYTNIIENDDGDKEIVLYISTDVHFKMTEFKNNLKRALPDYMYPHHIIEVEKLPMTLNGKVDSSKLPKPKLAIHHKTAKNNTTEELISGVYEEVLKTPIPSTNIDFYSLGGDSIKAIRIVSKLREYGFKVDSKTILETKSITKLVAHLTKDENTINPVVNLSDGYLGTKKLSPIQEVFFEKQMFVENHFNQSITLYCKNGFNEEIVKKAYSNVVNHHAQMKINFNFEHKPFMNENTKPFIFNSYEYDPLLDGDFSAYFRNICQYCHESFDIETKPLTNVALVNTNDGAYLFIVAHHLIVDGVSWRIILEDFETAYEQLELSQRVKLPKQTSGFDEWAYKVEEFSNDLNTEEENYWIKVTSEVAEKSDKDKKTKSTDILTKSLKLDSNLSKDLVLGIGRKANASINELFTASLVPALKGIDSDDLILMMESHGREEVFSDVSVDRTVGWFTTMYPMVLEDQGDTLKNISYAVEEFNKVPLKGFNYLSFKKGQRKKGNFISEPNMIFNYLGDMKNITNKFEVVELDTGKRNSEANTLWFPLTITGKYVDEQIIFDFTFDTKFYSNDIVHEAMTKFELEIQKTISICKELDDELKHPKSFGENQWSQEEFSKVLENVKFNGLKLEKIYPLSPMQENFLFNKMNDVEDNYFVQVVTEANTRLDEDKTLQVINLLTEIYEPLRTSIYYKGLSEPRTVQYIERKIPVQFHDLSLMNSNEQKDCLKEILKLDRQEGIDLENDSLLRLHVVHLTSEKTLLLWSFHHILMDGWCLDVLMEAFKALYLDDVECSKEELISSKGSYEEFVELVNNQNRVQVISYWKKLLEDYISEPLMIPEKNNQSNKNSYDNTSVNTDKELLKLINSVSASNNISVGTILETAWGILLQKYNLTNDIVIGKVVSGRNYQIKGIEKMVGLFINTIPIRIKINPELTFKQLINNIQKQNRQSEQNNPVSLSEINSFNRGAVQSLISYDVFDSEETGGGLSLKHIKTFEQTNYDLNFAITHGKELNFSLIYNSSKYDKFVMNSMLDRFICILKQCVSQINIKMKNLEIATSDEEKMILTKFNSEMVQDSLNNRTIIEAFEEQVAFNPNKIAIKHENTSISYSELNQKIDKVAQLLLSSGVKEKSIVISMMSRGSQAIEVFLGILKVGAIYLPIDPTNPDDRINYIINDCKADYIVTTSKLVQEKESCLRNTSLNKILFNSINLNDTFEVNQYVNEVKPSDSAYIIYTSGSTGKPKGVVIEHHSAVNMARGMKKEFKFEFDDVLQQFASLAFDASILEMLSAFLNGLTLVVVPERMKLNPDSVVELWNQEKVTWAVLPPIFVAEINDKNVKTLRSLKTAGEESNWEMVDKWSNKVNYANGYGPTEATVWSTTWFANQSHSKSHSKSHSVPIGKPAPNVQCYVLQEDKLCGIGVPGELCIGGAGIGKEYLNREALTREKFQSNPFTNGGRLYRTGDYARWMDDGNIEFMGRKDGQVKIRGNRVELGEIASHLRSNPSIKDAVVVATDIQNEKTICAYVTANSTIDVTTVKNELSKNLPSYMVPSYIVVLDKLPQSSSGKVDRTKLPDPNVLSEKSSKIEIKEVDEIQKKLINIFKSVLNKQKVELYENFFNIGGHSIRAAKVVNMINAEFKIELPLKVFFDNPSIDELYNLIKREEVNLTERIIKKSKSKNAQTETSLSHSATSTQKRLFTLQEISTGTTAYNIPALYEIKGILDQTKLQQAVSEVVSRHEAMRANFILTDCDVLINVRANVKPIVESVIDDSELEELYRKSIKPFNLKDELPFRVKVINNNENNYLFVDIHHVVCDGNSFELIVNEILNYYNGQVLPQVEMNLLEFSDIQNKNENNGSIDYWKKLYEINPKPLNLPLDSERTSRNDFKGQDLLSKMDKEMQLSIKSYCKKNNLTLYMFFLSVFMLYLGKKTKQSDIVIGTPINARDTEKSEKTVGMFVNTLPLRANIEAAKTFKELTNEMKEQTIQAFLNQSCPLEKIIALNDSNDDYKRNPLFDVMLAFNSYNTDSAASEDLEFKKIQFPTQTSPFELTLDILHVDDEITLRWEYKSAIFNRNTIKEMNIEFKYLMQQILVEDKTNIGQFSLTENNVSVQEKTQQEQIISVISEFLGNEIDFQKSFLEQGGDSIKAIRLVSKLRDVNVELDAQTILQSKSIKEFLPKNIEHVSKFSEDNVSENQIKEVLSKLLGKDLVSLEKSFLEQGGDSIKAIRASSKLNELGVNVDAQMILQANSLKFLIEEEVTNNKVGLVIKSEEGSSCEKSAILVELVKEILKVEDINCEKSFLEQGGDSIKAIRLCSKFREVGFEIEAGEFLQEKTIQISLDKMLSSNILLNNSEDREVANSKKLLISPIIETFFSQSSIGDRNYFNQANMIEFEDKLSLNEINMIFDKITHEHTIFSKNFSPFNTNNRFVENYGPRFEAMLFEVDPSNTPEFITKKCSEIQRSFDITNGPLFKVAAFNLENSMVLFLCAHHLVIDGVSWRILLDDFQQLKQQIKENHSLKLPPGTSTFDKWLIGLSEYSDSEDLKSELPYWEGISNHIQKSRLQGVPNQNENGFSNIEFEFDQKVTKMITSLCNSKYDIQINDILLTALINGIKKVTGQTKLSINMEGHGRELINKNIKVDRTIGWFTTVYPVILDSNMSGINEVLNATRKTLRNVPKNGIGFSVLKFISGYFNNNSNPNVAFNYMGVMDAEDDSIRISDFDFGPTISEKNTLWSDFNLNSVILNGKLKFVIDYNLELFPVNLANEIAKQIKNSFIELINPSTDNNKSYNDVEFRENELENPSEFSLTPLQEGMLFHKLSDENSTNYSTQTLFKVNGINTNFEVLKKAFSILPLKHHGLNIRFKNTKVDKFMQVINEPKELIIEEYDYTCSNESAEVLLERIKLTELNKKFDLENGDLFKVHFIKLKNDENYILINFHHIILDGWSLPNLLNSVQKNYRFLIYGDIDGVKKDIKKRDNFREYMKYIGGINKDEGVAYWRNLLDGYEEATNFDLILKEGVLDLEEPESEAEENIMISPEIVKKLNQFSKKFNITKNNVLETVWGLVLQKYNFSDDVVFGKVVSGRGYPVQNIEEIAGLLINTIPVRVKVSGNEIIKDVTNMVQKQSFESNKYSYSSLSSIQRNLKSPTNLVQTLISYSNFFSNEEEIPLNDETSLTIVSGRDKTNYDLVCSISDLGQEINIQLIYNQYKFSKQAVKLVLSVTENILDQIVSNPERKISEIQILNEIQKKEEIKVGLGEYKEIAKQTIPQAIEKNAELFPNNIAVSFEKKELTYSKLNQMSNVVADYLIKRGVKLEETVAILMEKSHLSIVSMLGVMKAGAVCLTIDPGNPTERIDYLIKDSNAKVVISDNDITDSEALIININKLDFEDLIGNPNIPINSSHLAYIMYTSGSTGNPKGSLIEYKGLMNLFDYMNNEFEINSSDNVLQFASLSFDASVLEIFGALVNGAKLVIASENIRKNPDELVNFMNDEEITFAVLPPALMSFIKAGSLKLLKYLINGGEEADPDVSYQWSQYTNYINAYGPSEASILTTAWKASQLSELPTKNPIGKPIQNIETYILNGGHLVGDGMPGELCIGGVSLSRGYLNRPETTNQMFVDLKDISQNKLYRTGDLVRRSESGELEYLGRIDNQVKIRGHRIELNEIEKSLKSFDFVKDVVAVVEKNNININYVAAYIVSDSLIDLSDLKEGLKKTLPNYMIPERFHQIEFIPLTQNGKTDKKSLKNLISPITETEYELTNNEKSIIQIFNEVLGTTNQNPNKSFMDIGGDSISAIRVTFKSKKLNFPIKVKDLLDGLSIKTLAKKCEEITIKPKMDEKLTLHFDKSNRFNQSNNIELKASAYKENIINCVNSKAYKGTEMQKWISHQPGIVSGHEFTIYGDYNFGKIESALRCIISEQAVLRSSYRFYSNQLFISEYPMTKNWKIPFTNIEYFGKDEKESILNLESQRFDENSIFKDGKLASELHVYKTDKSEYKIFLRIHHMFWDGMSAELFESQVQAYLSGDKKRYSSIYPYSEYVEMVNAHSLNENLLDVYGEKMEIESFIENIKLYTQTNRENYADSLATIPIPLSDYYQNKVLSNTWGILGNIIKSTDDLFAIRDTNSSIPLLILHHAREGKVGKYKNTLGLFLELVPIRLSNSNVDDLEVEFTSILEKYKEIKKEGSINILEYLKSKSLGNFTISMIEKVPVLNFLGLYDFINTESNCDSIEIKRIQEETNSKALIIALSEKIIHLRMFVSKEVADLIKTKLLKEFSSEKKIAFAK